MKRNARVKPKRESYADWMARIDSEVDALARSMEGSSQQQLERKSPARLLQPSTNSSVITKERVQYYMTSRRNLKNAWEDFLEAEKLLRQRESVLSALEARLDAEEKAIEEALANGADVIDRDDDE